MMTLDNWTATPLEGMTVREVDVPFPDTGKVVEHYGNLAVVMWGNGMVTTEQKSKLTPVEADLPAPAKRYFAKRASMSARTDEDAAMAARTFGSYDSLEEAKSALLVAALDEARSWNLRPWPDAVARMLRLARAIATSAPEVTEFTVGDLRFYIAEGS